MTIGQLRLSPHNVRKDHAPPAIAAKIAQLEASIPRQGLIQPLAIHPMRGRGDLFSVFAGGCRYKAISNLVGRQDLAGDWPVRVTLYEGYSDAELIELSLAENIDRADLLEHEIAGGVARAHAKGDTIEKIAEILGRDLNWAKEKLRIGSLGEPIFAAFTAGTITLAQAKAYASTDDRELQLQVFHRLSNGASWDHTPQHIRAAMKFGDRELMRLLNYIGGNAYREAGGRFELPLFPDSPGDRGRVVDEGLLRRLVDERLDQLREETRVLCGRPNMRFADRPPQHEESTDWSLRVDPKVRGEETILPRGEIIGVIEIVDPGHPATSYWWESRSAKHGSADKPVPEPPVSLGPNRRTFETPVANAINDMASPGLRRDADAAIKEEAGLSQDAIQILRAVRRQILRAALIHDANDVGEVARDYLIWAQLRMLAGAEHSSRTGMCRLNTETIGGFELGEKARVHMDAMPAKATIDDALVQLTRQPFFTDQDLGAAFRKFRATDQRLKDLAAAFVAGAALERSLNAPGYSLPIHNVVAEEAYATDVEVLREHWTPTEAFLGLFPAKQRLALADGVAPPDQIRRWSTLRTADLTRAMLPALEQQAWMPELLTFAPPIAAAELKEAAE
jgi:ParB family chromosome partitioning protein